MNYSFIIPVYNCQPYLDDCVASIRAIGAESYEILLIDDGSTDGSGALCDGLAERYSKIRVIHQANGGASAARNRGIQEARGEKILFLDADDSIDSAALGKVLFDPRCDQADLVIFGLTFDYYYHGKCYRRDPIYYEYDGILSQSAWNRDFSELYMKNALSPVWNKVFKRDILLQYGLELNTEMFLYEDFEFVLRYLRHCGSIWNVPQAIYHYRQSEDEGNAKRRLARIQSLSEFLKPIEISMENLSHVSEKEKNRVLTMLFQILAREKVSISPIADIRNICEDFRKWEAVRDLPEETSVFRDRLLNGKAMPLYWANKKTALRHWIAVRVKALLRK